MAAADAAARAALPAGIVGAAAAAIAAGDATDGGGTESAGTVPGAAVPGAAVPGGAASAEGAPASAGIPAGAAVGAPGAEGEPAGAWAAGRGMGEKTDGVDWRLPASAGPPGPGAVPEILGSGSVCASGSSVRPSTDGGRYSRRRPAGGGG